MNEKIAVAEFFVIDIKFEDILIFWMLHEHHVD